MAKVQMKFPTGFLNDIDLANEEIDRVVPDALQKVGKEVANAIKGKLKGSIGKGKLPSKSTGELEKSLGVSPSKLNNNGDWNVKVGFVEPRSDGGVNAKIANILEYGSSTQKAQPFLRPTKRAMKKQVEETLAKEISEGVSILRRGKS